MHINDYAQSEGMVASQPHTKDIMMFVKKSPRTIIYNTRMFVRNTDGSSKLADSDGLISVLQICAPTKYTPHHTTEIFTKRQSFQYDEELPPESMYIEYKHWKVNNVSDIINNIKKDRYTKGLFVWRTICLVASMLLGLKIRHCK